MEEQRIKKITPQEKNYLTSLVLNSKDVIEDKKIDSMAIMLKKRKWAEITESFNRMPGYTKRSTDQLKKCWDNIKTTRKKQLTIERRARLSSASNPFPPSSQASSEAGEIDILQIMSMELETLFDSDSAALADTGCNKRFTFDLDPLEEVNHVEEACYERGEVEESKPDEVEQGPEEQGGANGRLEAIQEPSKRPRQQGGSTSLGRNAVSPDKDKRRLEQQEEERVQQLHNLRLREHELKVEKGELDVKKARAECEMATKAAEKTEIECRMAKHEEEYQKLRHEKELMLLDKKLQNMTYD